MVKRKRTKGQTVIYKPLNRKPNRLIAGMNACAREG